MKGTVRKRGTTWSYQHERTRDGVRGFVTKGGFRTKRAAQQELTDKLAALRAGTYVEPNRMTVAEYLRAEWLPVVEHSVKPSTFRGYSDIVEHRLVPHLGDVRLAELGPGHIATLYSELRVNGRRDGNGGLSATSVEHTHRVLRKALADATRRRLLVRNPADDVVKPRRATAEMSAWTRAELLAFLAHVEGDRLRACWVLAATTGMRRGELLGLRWTDVDLDAATVSVRRSRVAVGYEVVEGPPKSKRSTRVLDVDAETVAALRRWRAGQLEERLRWGAAWVDSGAVFTREDGEPIHPHSLAWAFEKAVRDSGVRPVRFHDLRHTHATLLLQAGTHPKVVSERLGHATISITLDTYSHVIPGMGAEAATKFGALLFGTADR